MPGLDDCYVFVEKRDGSLIDLFLNEFLPERKEAADDYLVPEYSDNPSHEFQSAPDLIEFLCDNKKETYAIYWNSKRDEDPSNAMVFFTEDGGMIFGLSCDADGGNSKTYLQKMKNFLKSELGYIAFEEPPPGTKAEFLDYAEKYNT